MIIRDERRPQVASRGGGGVIVGLALASGMACGGSPSAPSDSTGLPTAGLHAVRGVVTDARTHNVVAGAAVTISRSGTVTSTTDFSGRFVLSAIATGEVNVRATADGYEPEARTVNIVADTTVDLAIRAQPGGRVPCGTAANRGNRTLLLLSAPFRGTFRHTNFFDHDLPLQNGGNGHQLTSCGDRVATAGDADGHNGHDWSMPTGTPVLAAAAGEVTFAGPMAPFACAALGRTVSDQLTVEVLHPAAQAERVSTTYTHLSRLDVQAGRTVTEGQQIGLSGNTGCTTQPQLHFGARRLSNTQTGDPAFIDPYGWEGDGADPWASHAQGAGSFWLWKPGQAPSLQ